MAYNDKILQTPQIFIPEVRKMDRKYGKRGTPELSFTLLWPELLFFYAVLLCTKSKSFPEANMNRKKKIYVSIKYILSLLYIWPGQMKMVMCHENFSFVHLGVKYRCWNRQSLRGIIHGCFQVCKHLISCILRCARRDHLGHICCKLKHFKFEATLCRNRLQQEGRTCLQ